MNLTKIATFVFVMIMSMTAAFAAGNVEIFSLNNSHNDIVFTVLPNDTSVTSVLADIEGKYTTIETKGTNPILAWDINFVGVLDSANTLQHIEYGQKYVLTMTEAATLTVTGDAQSNSASTFTVGDVNSDDEAERSEPFRRGDDQKLDDKVELTYLTVSVPFKATGDAVTVNNIALNSGFTYLPFGGDVTSADIVKFDTTFPFTVKDATKIVKISILIPSNLDAVDTNGKVLTHTVNVVSQTSKGQIVSQVKFDAENFISVDNVEGEAGSVDFECDVEDDFELDCDDEAEELPTDDDVSIRFTVENNGPLDLEDVEFEIDEDNRDVDVDDKSFEEDIDEDDEIEVTVRFEVDSDIDDGEDVEFTFAATVEDEYGARHGFFMRMDVEFDEDSNDGSSSSSRNRDTDRDSSSSNNADRDSSISDQARAYQQYLAEQAQNNNANANQQTQEPVIVVQNPQPQFPSQSTVVEAKSSGFPSKETLMVVGLALVILVLVLICISVAVALIRRN